MLQIVWMSPSLFVKATEDIQLGDSTDCGRTYWVRYPDHLYGHDQCCRMLEWQHVHTFIQRWRCLIWRCRADLFKCRAELWSPVTLDCRRLIWVLLPVYWSSVCSLLLWPLNACYHAVEWLSPRLNHSSFSCGGLWGHVLGLWQLHHQRLLQNKVTRGKSVTWEGMLVYLLRGSADINVNGA